MSILMTGLTALNPWKGLAERNRNRTKQLKINRNKFERTRFPFPINCYPFFLFPPFFRNLLIITFRVE